MHIGSRGWLHPHWANTFYPDDLPDEWRFSYYSNEFSCVLLPCEYWLNAEHADVVRWIEDCDDDFVFYVEIDIDGDIARQLSLVAVLLPQLSAVVMKGQTRPLSPRLTQHLPQYVLEIAQTVGDGVALYCYEPCSTAVNQSQSIGRVLVLADRENNEKLTDKTGDSGLAGSDYIALLASSEKLSIMQVKSHIEALIRFDSGSVCQALFVAGDYPNLDQLRQATQLYALMA